MGFFTSDKAWTQSAKMDSKIRKAKRKQQLKRYRDYKRDRRKRWGIPF